ncbi:CHAP domain-containing protein [Lentzea sp. NPDC092896]|uniref:CHAP domain-containing protein n=1 Tax=Lentzea sp. NPDC092896 TaxID=3364127 RepID=UPI00380A6DBF
MRIHLTLRRRLAPLVALMLGVALVAPTASAASTTLCTGYAGCANTGRGNSDYSANSGTSYWGMYAGHNCTNYAAYRLVRNGADASYLRGHGMAYEWGSQAQAHGVSVNSTPAVGAIAWWAANSGGSGSTGHVAYVEEVGSGYILVSEDNWGGDFHWKKMTPGGYYPTGFIHFKDMASAPNNPPPAQPSPRRSSNVVFGPSGYQEVYGRGPTDDLVHKWFVPGAGWQPSAFGDFEHLGTGLGGEPTAIRRPNGILDVFARGTNGDLLHKWLTPGVGWQPSPYGDFERLGTGLGGDPIAIIRPNGTLDIFARGTNGDLLHKWMVDGVGWGPSPYGDFERLGGGLGGDPVALVQVNGQLDVFARGANGDLLHKWMVDGVGWQPSPFGDFERLGGGLASDVSVTQLANGQLHVFGRGPAGDLMHKWLVHGVGWQPSPFGDFERLGSGLASEPVALQQANGQLDIFGRGSANDLWHKWFVSGIGWQPTAFGEPERLGTGLVSEPSLIQQANGQLDIFGQGTGGDLVHKWVAPGVGWQPSPFGDFEHLGSGY